MKTTELQNQLGKELIDLLLKALIELGSDLSK